ncbi:histidine kinase dimerization/phosphoacceptor domain -containing protein [Massilia sp. CCM 9210]|uniref:histidine kinase dimerization/phosphoacceptor domain -containing protein n=1 Tax=Massilia scottii TaxID=3057166 RepID=UPI002796CF46|nr:histidine kinase dimerization/phosphoacceptor domain -containing protein [Massilia sp. CCM 9210]MDQ1817253.1 histidine kinase dimerization/phosphoacceptor domain -containing protein [Massilia sp. CCM 9210]
MNSTLAVLSPDEHEAQRMQSVRRYDILDTPPDGSFDHVTEVAARLMGTPIAIISIVDADRIWFKSHHGVEVAQIAREPGLCASAIMHDGPWLVGNAPLDPRTISNPLVAGEFGLQFYLGIPLETHDGFKLGTLCVLDFQPRSVSQDQIANLQGLARVVMDQLELRLTARQSIANLSVAVEQKEAALAQAKLMTQEIDHRVLNSLGLIVSLLGVQSMQLRGTPAAEEITKAAGKIMAVAEVHKHMQTDSTVNTADCAEYLQRLCLGLSSVLSKNETTTIHVDAVSVSLPSEQIVRIGLIVNELATNAMKQGASQLVVSLTRLDDAIYCLGVTDDGTGLPTNFAPDEMSGLGMKVISSLVRNLQGNLSYGPAFGARGTRFEVTFPILSI